MHYYTPPLPSVQWQRNPAVNAPLVQGVTGPSRFVQVVDTLSLPGVRNGTPFRLFGTSDVSYLNFDVQGKLSVNKRTGTAVVSTRSNNPLPPTLGIDQGTINWEITTPYQFGTAIQGSLGTAETIPAGADPSHFQPVYSNGDPSKRLYLIGGRNGRNVFEAAAVYTYNGQTRIYPGGQSGNPLTPDDLNQILDLFTGVGFFNPDGTVTFVHNYKPTPP